MLGIDPDISDGRIRCIPERAGKADLRGGTLKGKKRGMKWRGGGGDGGWGTGLKFVISSEPDGKP